MKSIQFLAAILVVATLSSCNGQTVAKKELKTELDSVSYALGLNMADQLKVNFSDIDKDLFVQGFSNGIDSTELLMKTEDLGVLLSAFFQKRQEQQQQEQFGDIKEAGATFLAENKSKEGVKTTASGLQYLVMKEGNGEKPVGTSNVKIHYHGTSLDGKVFDSSVDKGTPIELMANQFVSGFTEGLLLMNVGSKFKFFIPYDLAYGASPRPGGPIKPYESLIFEVELLDIIK